MLTLATLVVGLIRSGGLGAASLETGATSARTARAATVAAVLAFIVVLFGAATANVPGAAQSCVGFPICRLVLLRGTPLMTQLAHRALAFLLFLHVFGLAYSVKRRNEDPRIVLASRLAFAVIVLQIVVAAALVELRLPAPLQSLHQAVGTLVWITIFAFATLARVGAGVGETSPGLTGAAPQPVTTA
jgi:heme A synthase